MTNKNLDWDRLKLEYMTAETMSVSQFLRDKRIIREGKAQNSDGNVQRRVKGWKDDKKDLQKRMYDKALLEYEGKRKSDWKKAFKSLEVAELKQISEFATLLSEGEIKRTDEKGNTTTLLSKYDPNMIKSTRYIIDIMKYLRLTQGKPTEIAVNFNTDDKPSLTPDDIRAFKELGISSPQIKEASEGIEAQEKDDEEEDDEF